MADGFSDRLVDAVRNCKIDNAAARALVTRAIADTVCVAAPGFFEPVTRNTLFAYGGSGAKTWSGETCESSEAAVMINAIAAHALDFDDVYLDGMAHASTVIVPAIVTDGPHSDNADEVIAAFGAGLIAAHAVAQRLGQGHYNKGWHGTGTVGAFAAAAAAGRLHRLSHEQMASAFALCASMSGGLRVNFGTQAKPAHAGFAAVAGLRAVRLAMAGVNGAPDVFGKQGYIDLYGGDDGVSTPSNDVFVAQPEKVSIKLYPCCYAAHRLIGAALDARAALASRSLDPMTLQFILTAPAGSLEVLKYDRPTSPLEAKFSARFNIAVALLDGVPTLQHYATEVVKRSDVAALMDRIDIVEDQTQQSGGDIEFGKVTLDVRDGTRNLERVERSFIPGSPDDPPSREVLGRKLQGCLRGYEESKEMVFPGVAHLHRLGADHWLGGN
jgi:2-methylcitrate dehydratase PrpD